MTAELAASIGAARGMAAYGSREVHAQAITPALRRQRWSLQGQATGVLSHAVHLSAGRGLVLHAQGELALRAPDVVWLPAGRARELQVEAGSVGVSVGFSDALLAKALSEREDEAPLRQVSSRLVVVTPPEGALRAELVRSLMAVEAEARSGSGGLRPYLSAHLTILLVALWRLSSHDVAQLPSGAPARQRLLRFRHLVEAQFRTRWPVSRYASELGLSPDGLHDLCVRSLGRSPLSLVHERVVGEACTLLARTDLGVDQLSADLGFDSPSHFSRFFKRWTGRSPTHWREGVRVQAQQGQARQQLGYGDWP
ncbi:MAG: helix-turn-helix domain-containing protein [Rubrivivax sp.]|jgi:AraC family transcriptional activator of pobA|nr:AraC family transcriptional regulator [Rubrivivax sp.]